MRLYNELQTVLKAFNFKAAGIDVIVLKGAFLAELVYENIGLRAIGDVDLLVKKEDLGKVKRVLIHLGYQALPTRWGERLNELWETEWAEERHFTKANNVDIDVHWYIQDRVDPFQIDIADLWEHAQPVVLAGVETLMLAPEDQLLHLCLHLERHMRNKGAVSFKWYCDIAAVIGHYRTAIDWTHLVQQSQLVYTLGLLRCLLQLSPVPCLSLFQLLLQLLDVFFLSFSFPPFASLKSLDTS